MNSQLRTFAATARLYLGESHVQFSIALAQNLHFGVKIPKDKPGFHPTHALTLAKCTYATFVRATFTQLLYP